MSFYNYEEEKRFVESVKLIGIGCGILLKEKEVQNSKSRKQILKKYGHLLIRAVESIAMHFLFDDSDTIQQLGSNELTGVLKQVNHMDRLKQNDAIKGKTNSPEFLNQKDFYLLIQYLITYPHKFLQDQLSNEEYTYFKACWHIVIMLQILMSMINLKKESIIEKLKRDFNESCASAIVLFTELREIQIKLKKDLAKKKKNRRIPLKRLQNFVI